MEGTIRCWSLPTKEEAEAMPSASFVRGVWDNSEDEKQEPVWQLLYSKDEVLDRVYAEKLIFDI